jgi:hypothetical protein
MNAPSVMQILRFSLLLVAVISYGSLHSSNTVATELDKKAVGKFLRTFCAECHGDETQEGERRLDQFKLPIKTVAQLITADEIIDQLTLKSMPPSDAPQPDDQQRVKLITHLRGAIAEARGRFDSTGGRTVIRRLSNREYENTMAALFNRRVDTLGLTADFPKDGTSNHIDTIGETLVTSGFLLDEYFQAASRMVDLRLGKPPTEEKQWHFTNNFRQYEELSGSHKSVFNYNFLCL